MNRCAMIVCSMTIRSAISTGVNLCVNVTESFEMHAKLYTNPSASANPFANPCKPIYVNPCPMTVREPVLANKFANQIRV